MKVRYIPLLVVLFGGANASAKEDISDEELLYHFERVFENRDTPSIKEESWPIVMKHGEQLLPLLAKRFREKKGDLEYQHMIVGVFGGDLFKGDKTLILEDVRQLLPTLTGELPREGRRAIIHGGLYYLSRYGSTEDLAILDLFSGHKVEHIRNHAKSCRERLEQRLAEPPSSGSAFGKSWWSALAVCLVGGVAALITVRHRAAVKREA